MNISKDSSSFVLLTDIVPDILLDIRYYSTFNFVGERIRGYEAPLALLTEQAALVLKSVAQKACEKGYRLLIYDAYRPQRAVDHFQEWGDLPTDIRMKRYFYPNRSKSELFDQGFIMRKSAHSRGSTVDISLFDMNKGQIVDMGSNFDFFGQRSFADYTGCLSDEQLANRQTLRDLMVTHDFHPLKEEWWHFTLNNEPFPETYFDFPITLSKKY
ncbi:MAG: M15 family metallopeptidase [Desulfovibrionaceae bacterium]|nr:M15 family metallopeptidase [Desulfovibrionaceae bacterium]